MSIGNPFTSSLYLEKSCAKSSPSTMGLCGKLARKSSSFLVVSPSESARNRSILEQTVQKTTESCSSKFLNRGARAIKSAGVGAACRLWATW